MMRSRCFFALHCTVCQAHESEWWLTPPPASPEAPFFAICSPSLAESRATPYSWPISYSDLSSGIGIRYSTVSTMVARNYELCTVPADKGQTRTHLGGNCGS